MYPHRNGSGCPAIINARGGWHGWESDVDAKITILKTGGPVPPAETYADVVKVPKTWDGTDYVRDTDGHVFVALSRVFTVDRLTSARVSADPRSRKVRADLKPGEAFLSHYVTEGSDGKPWLVSQFHSRISAEDCSPKLSSFTLDGTELSRIGLTAASGAIPHDPTSGLSAAEVPENAPAISKADFMSPGKPSTREIKPSGGGHS
jgi:hypothetical protein